MELYCFFLMGFDDVDLLIIGIYFIEYFAIVGVYSEIEELLVNVEGGVPHYGLSCVYYFWFYF